jgi:hypothetical protein
MEYNEAVGFVHIVFFRDEHSHFRASICPCFPCSCFRSCFLLTFRTVWSYTFTPPYIFMARSWSTETILPLPLLRTAPVTLLVPVHPLVVIRTTLLPPCPISLLLHILPFSGHVLFFLLLLDFLGACPGRSEPGSHSRLICLLLFVSVGCPYSSTLKSEAARSSETSVGLCAYSSTLKSETARSSEMSVSLYQTTLCHIPYDNSLHSHRHENFKSTTSNQFSGSRPWRFNIESKVVTSDHHFPTLISLAHFGL